MKAQKEITLFNLGSVFHEVEYRTIWVAQFGVVKIYYDASSIEEI